MAILVALRSPEVEVIGLTTIFGNVYTSLATRNALHLVSLFLYSFFVFLFFLLLLISVFSLSGAEEVCFLSLLLSVSLTNLPLPKKKKNLIWLLLVGDCWENRYPRRRRISCHHHCTFAFFLSFNFFAFVYVFLQQSPKFVSFI